MKGWERVVYPSSQSRSAGFCRERAGGVGLGGGEGVSGWEGEGGWRGCVGLLVR